MKKLDLNRRTVLKGAGTVAVALPWLEAMMPTKALAQDSSTAKRFLSVFTPGGTVRNKWRCNGSENNFQLSPILSPLESVKQKLLVLHGLDMASAVGEQHQAGIIALMTGTPQSGAHNQYASGPSVDQVIANRIGGNSAKKSVQIAIRWATGKSHGLLHPINSMTFEDNRQFSPIPPRLDPVAIWQDLFGSVEGGDPQAAAKLARKKSILDFVDRRYDTLARQLGADDRARLEQHLTKIREIENGLANEIVAGGACSPPPLVNTAGYNPTTGLNSSDNGQLTDGSTDATIPLVGKLMMDMVVMAMACEITSVATLQWSDTEAKHTFPWLGLGEHHHFYQHDGGFRPAECELIGHWYAQQHAYLLKQMDSMDMGGHSLLDESVVFFGSELADPPTHRKDDMPFLLAGRGGGLNSGRLLDYGGRSHNDLLVSILNLFGDDRNTFGDQRYCNGPLSGIV